MLGEKKRYLVTFSAILAVLLVTTSLFAASVPSFSDLNAVVPGSKTYRHEIRPLDIYIMIDGKGSRVGTAFITSNIPPEVGGYRDEIDVLVGIDNQGRITGTKILDHRETPDFMRRILDSGFLKKFIGKRSGDSYADIETVTGATISSQAIKDDIRTSVETVMSKLKGAGGFTSFMKGFDFKNIIGSVAVVLLALLVVVACMKPKLRYLRWITLTLSVFTIGFWLNTPITIGNLVFIRYLGGMFTSNFPLAFLISFAIVAAILRGNLYCSYLCPFGALQIVAAKLRLPKIRPEEHVVRAAGWVRWVVTIFTVYAIVKVGSGAFETIEPFSLCFSKNPKTVVLVQTIVVLVAAFFVRRVWCRFMCPTGLVMDILSIFGAKIRTNILSYRRGRIEKHKVE